MTNIDWEAIIRAYENGLTADMLRAQFQEKWSSIWTAPPCSPDAMERAGRQFCRTRALKILHIRRAILHGQNRPDRAVVVATELPDRRQQIRDLITTEEIVLRHYLQDDALTALENSFMPKATLHNAEHQGSE